MLSLLSALLTVALRVTRAMLTVIVVVAAIVFLFLTVNMLLPAGLGF